ncbi:cache domain-containing protein [Malaciobacter mytili]|uniref:sensor histidine kinase n=1 Tax=Malaciobacter mytili TaxID=603050 RepID=UPI003A871B95
MLKNNEKKILQIIKFAPIVFILFLSTLTTYLLILNNQTLCEEDIKKIEKEFINNQKEQIKTEVTKIYEYIVYEKNKSEERLKKQLKSRVNEAHNIATNIYKENKFKTKNEILKMIKDALREIRFNEGRGYYFIHDIKGNNLLYPLDIKLENKNYLNLKDTNGYYFVKTIVDVIKNKTETFDTYYWSKPTNEGERIYKKISFYKYFEPLNISISTGEYLEDFEKDLKKNILEYIDKINEKNKRYIFIFTHKGEIIIHKPTNSHLKVDNSKTTEKVNLLNEVIKIAKNKKGGFITYSDSLIYNTSLINYKTSYVKSFKEWEWIIGSGFYIKELEPLINKRKQQLYIDNKTYAINIIIISLLITIVLLIISFYISKKIEKRFTKYKEKIYKEINKNRKKDSLLAQQSKMASMGEMIGNIAHQWRQPLSLISTIASGMKMQKEFGLLDDKEFENNINNITKTTQHLSKTIDDFKNFFKPNKDKERFKAYNIIEKSLSLVSAQFKSRNIDIIKDIENIEIYGLENELIQVLINILNNARDELIKNDFEPKLIFICIKRENNQVKIKIKDNAGGVPIKFLDKIFEPYFTTKHQTQGTGIGLYMSQEIIVKHMSGNIEVENIEFMYEKQHFKGAQFTISLPF